MDESLWKPGGIAERMVGSEGEDLGLGLSFRAC